jgi:hypothetical protein
VVSIRPLRAAVRPTSGADEKPSTEEVLRYDRKRKDKTVSSYDQLYAVPNGQELHDTFEERLRENTTTPVPDQVQFRIDWPAWLSTLTGRERRMIRVMARNESTKNLAHQFDLSPARISQKRREFHDEWQQFCGETNQVAVSQG